MTIEESKNLLKVKGYTSFNLKDFNQEYYDFLLPFKCNETNNLKKEIKGLRADYPGCNFNKDRYNTFEEAEADKNEIIKKLTESAEGHFSQIYYQTSFNPIFEKFTKVDSGNNPMYNNIISNITKHFFDLDESIELGAPTNITYYDKECMLASHSDGTGTGRICAMLIYLNETYDYNDGGILVLGNEYKVLPVFGNVAIIDLQSFDISHEVTKVTAGLGRFALLSFVKRKEDEFK